MIKPTKGARIHRLHFYIAIWCFGMGIAVIAISGSTETERGHEAIAAGGGAIAAGLCNLALYLFVDPKDYD